MLGQKQVVFIQYRYACTIQPVRFRIFLSRNSKSNPLV